MAAAGRSSQPQKPKQEYAYAVLAVHPVTKKPITKEVFDTEDAAHKDCARRNQDGSHFSHHVKKIKKGPDVGSSTSTTGSHVRGSQGPRR